MSVESKISKVLRMVEDGWKYDFKWNVKILNNIYFSNLEKYERIQLAKLINDNKYKKSLDLVFSDHSFRLIQIENKLTSSSVLKLIDFIKEIKEKIPKITSASFLDYVSREYHFPPDSVILNLNNDVFTFYTLLKLLILISLNAKLKRLISSNDNYSNISTNNENSLVLNKLLSEFDFSLFKNYSLTAEDKKYVINLLIKYLQEKLNIEKLDDLNLVIDKDLFYVLPDFIIKSKQNYIEDITIIEEFVEYLRTLLDILNKAFEESSSNKIWDDLEAVLNTVLSEVPKKSLDPLVKDIENEMIIAMKTYFIKNGPVLTNYIDHRIYNLLNRPKSELATTSRILNSYIEKKGTMMGYISRNIGYPELFDKFIAKFYDYVAYNPELSAKLMYSTSLMLFIKIKSSERMKSFFTKEFKKQTGNLIYYGTLMVIFHKVFYYKVIDTNSIRKSSEDLNKIYRAYLRFCDDIRVKCYDTGLKLRVLLENLLKFNYEKYNRFLPAEVNNAFDYEHLPLENRIFNSINLLKVIKDDFKHCLDNESSSENTVLKKVVNHIKGGFIIYENYINFNINLLDYYLKTFEGLV